jgi:hypothetical protein
MKHQLVEAEDVLLRRLAVVAGPKTLATVRFVLFIAVGLATGACADSGGPPVPKGWAANEEIRANGRRAEARAVQAEYLFYDVNGGPYRYVETNPAKITKLIDALKESRRRDILPVENFIAGAVFDSVDLKDKNGETVASARVPGDPTDWHGPNFAKLYADAKKKAK